jgi:hypothetical protein
MDARVMIAVTAGAAHEVLSPVPPSERRQLGNGPTRTLMAETPRRPRLVEEFIAAYEEADAATRADRAERAACLAGLGWPESGWQFFGGDPTASWEELRRTFIDGSYLATILVGHVFLENLLAGQPAFLLQEDVGRPQLSDVLKRTRDRGWLSPDEFAVLDALREMRNPTPTTANSSKKRPRLSSSKTLARSSRLSTDWSTGLRSLSARSCTRITRRFTPIRCICRCRHLTPDT